MWNVIIYNFEFCFWPNRIVNHSFECFKPTFVVMVIGVYVTIKPMEFVADVIAMFCNG